MDRVKIDKTSSYQIPQREIEQFIIKLLNDAGEEIPTDAQLIVTMGGHGYLPPGAPVMAYVSVTRKI